MKTTKTVTTDTANAVSKTTDNVQNRSVLSNATKINFILIFMAFCLKATAQISLPYNSDFENTQAFFNETPLSGDWATTDTSVVITDDIAQSGSQSVRIPAATPENIVSLGFDPSGNSILFLDYHAKLTTSDLPELPLLTTPETTAMLTVRSYGTGFGEWVFLDGNGTGSGNWYASGNPLGLDTAGQTSWQQITLRLNLQSNLWDVYINGKLSAFDLGFAEAPTSGSEAINLFGNTSGATYLDNLSLLATNPLFTDLDQDGIEDAFENAYGLNASINDRYLDADADGLTNIYEFMADLLPNSKDTDGDGLEDGWEVHQGYSASSNEGIVGAFGDLEGDRLANQTESNVGSSMSTVDTVTTLASTNTQSGGDLAITLIGRGTFTIDETATASRLSD